MYCDLLKRIPTLSYKVFGQSSYSSADKQLKDFFLTQQHDSFHSVMIYLGKVLGLKV